MIDGVGIDVVDIARFSEALERTSGLKERLFTVAEQSKPIASLAARFAAKEGIDLLCSATVKSRSFRPEVRSSASENLAISTTSIPTPSIMLDPFVKE